MHAFGPRLHNVNKAYSRDVFKGSEARKKHNRGRPDDQKTLNFLSTI